MVLIEDILNIPKEAQINDKIPKKLIYEEANLNKQDKDIFIKFVDEIKWLYKIDNSSIRVKPFKNSEREYLEMEIINVILKDEFEKYYKGTGNFHRFDAKLDRIADILLRFIPYPILLSFQFNEDIKLYVSHLKESHLDYDKITLDKLIYTDWIESNNLTQIDKNFINSLKLDNLDFTNLYTFYDSFVTAIIQYNGSKEVGEVIDLDSSNIQEIMDDIEDIDYQIAILKSKMRKEPNFNDKMDINIQINKLKIDRKKLEEQLSGG